jgi:hypothetical protein
MSHETFAAKQHSVCQHPFKHVVVDAFCQLPQPHCMEAAYRLPGRPSLLLLTSESASMASAGPLPGWITLPPAAHK